MFTHNRDKREIGSRDRISGGGAVILFPSAVITWKTAGSKNITTPITSKFVGQLIGVNLLFPKLDQYYMRVKGGLTFFCSIDISSG